MNSDTARQLFESGGLLLVLDAPKEMEFGIDMYSWRIGPQFNGIKMIPPGIHLVYYSERDSISNQLSNRQSFFVEFSAPDQMLVVIRWSPLMTLFERVILTPNEYETRRNQRYELDRLLGQYPLDTYRQWLSLSNHFRLNFIEKIIPPNGHICSANVFNPGDKRKIREELRAPTNLAEAEARLPAMVPATEFTFRFTSIQQKNKNFNHHFGSDLTRSKLDRTDELKRIVDERFDSNINGLLCELQLSFVVFLLGQLYDGFEQWKSLFDLICSCQQAFGQWPLFYIDFLQTIYFQLQQFSGDANGEHLFVDIDQNENCVYKSLENLFANIHADDNEHMEGEINDKLLQRCEKMKQFLAETYKWTFDDEPDDEKPIVVELDNE